MDCTQRVVACRSKGTSAEVLGPARVPPVAAWDRLPKGLFRASLVAGRGVAEVPWDALMRAC